MLLFQHGYRHDCFLNNVLITNLPDAFDPEKKEKYRMKTSKALTLDWPNFADNTLTDFFFIILYAFLKFFYLIRSDRTE